MPRLSFAPPSLCSPLTPTIRDLEVPPLFRRRFILGGYRPVGHPWQLYMLSLFQMHNETLSVWSPLVAAAILALRSMIFTLLKGGGVLGLRLQGPEGQGPSVDVSSLPLVCYMFSALAFLSCSAAAHLLHPHSEHAHHSLFFLKNVGGAIYLYCCALALYLYSSEPAWTQSMLGKIFLPAAAVLSWTSCAASCYVRVHPRRMWTIHRKLYVLTGIIVISPTAHRLATHSWTSSPAVSLHLLQLRCPRSQPSAPPRPAVAPPGGPAGGALPRLPVETPSASQALWRGAPPAGRQLLSLAELLLRCDRARPEEAGSDPDHHRRRSVTFQFHPAGLCSCSTS